MELEQDSPRHLREFCFELLRAVIAAIAAPGPEKTQKRITATPPPMKYDMRSAPQIKFKDPS